MTSHGFWRFCIFVAAGAMALAGQAFAATPSSAPAGADATQVRRGDLVLSLNFDGTFVPNDPSEVRLKLKGYHGDLIVKKTASSGATVVTGDLLLELDPQKIDIDIAAAKNDLTIAQANLAKAQSDVALGAKADGLAMTNASNALANAKTSLTRWDGPDGKAFLLASKANVMNNDTEVQNATDELDQLRKMYKTEDLTNSTADIVMKRAVRSLEMNKLVDDIGHARADRTEHFDAVIQRQQLAAAVDQQTLAVQQLTAAQTQGQTLRQGALVTAQAAVDEAARKLDDLQKDRLSFDVHSAMGGVVVYGAFTDKAWQEIEASHFAPGEKVDPDKVLMTVFGPTDLSLTLECPESQLTLFSDGPKVKVMPIALPGVSYEGVCGKVPVVGRTKGPQRYFDIDVNLTGVDDHIAPGFGADVLLDAGTLQNVLLVPNSAISHGRVWISKQPPEMRNVVIGQSDGRETEIKTGLQEGEYVLTRARDAAH